MFTGIITDIGEIARIDGTEDRRARILCGYDAKGIDIGASIACAGCCLTVTSRGAEGDRTWFDVDISAETLSKTVLGGWKAGARINLERSLRVGDELGGHIVSGHVDGVGTITRLADEGDSLRVSITAPDALAKFIAEKGSVAIDGASLTVNEVEGPTFGVNLIPHTRTVTTFGDLVEGQQVNLEIDVLARYVARLEAARR